MPHPLTAPGDHACPAPYQFPTDLALAAGLAMDDLATEDDTVGTTLGTAAAGLDGDRVFEGATADMFRLSLQARFEARAWGALTLATERQRVNDLMAAAATAEADRDAEITACRAAHP